MPASALSNSPTWTRTFTVPGLPAGTTAVRLFVPATTTFVDAAVPKNTCVFPTWKPAPLIVTVFPPAGGPDRAVSAI